MSHNWYASTNNSFSLGSTSNDLANNKNSPLSSNTNNSSKSNLWSFTTTVNPWIFSNGNPNTSTIAIHFYFLFIFCFAFCLLCTAENFKLSSMTLASPVYHFGAAVYDNTLYIFDGSTKDTELHAPFNYNLSNGVSWLTQNIPDFYFGNYSSPTSIYYYGQCDLQIEETVYGMFPSTTNLAFRTMLKYSLANNSYFGTNTYDAVRSSTRGDGSCATFNSQLNIIYSMGRFYTEYYNLSNDSWASISHPSEKTWYSGCAMDINSQYIFKFGGLNSNLKDIIEKYDVNSGGWEILNVKLKQIIAYLGCMLYKNVDNKIYCTGGFSSVYLSEVHVFDPESLTIDFVSYKLNKEGANHRLILYDQCIFVVGGFNGIKLDSIEYLCLNPTASPSTYPTMQPSLDPTTTPSQSPTNYPTMLPSTNPSKIPSSLPTNHPTTVTAIPSNVPTLLPSAIPTAVPSDLPTNGPSTNIPSNNPTSTKAVTVSKEQYSTEFILSIAVSILSCLLIASIVYVCWVRYKNRRKAGFNVFSEATKGDLIPMTPLKIQMDMENKNVDNMVVQSNGNLNITEMQKIIDEAGVEGRNLMTDEGCKSQR